MVHPDRRKPGPVVESPAPDAERHPWQPPRAVPEPAWHEVETSVSESRRLPPPVTPGRVQNAGCLR